ncbi:MAG TPA: hypothetical protein VH501_10580 [Solirubrobacterales bacterium]|jgi:membrane protein implicated in regulation of membrane protease activity
MESQAARDRAQSLDEIWKWTVGAGILLVALAPLALPILVLTIVALLPLAVPLLAVGLLAAVIAAPVALIRRIAGRRRIRDDGARPEAPAHRTGSLGARRWVSSAH